MNRDEYILKLSHKNPQKRLKYTAKLGKLLKKDGERKSYRACCGSIHSDYSFSPYTPSLAAYMAYNNGLSAAALIDTGTLAGGREFLAAAKNFGIAATVGVGYPTPLPKAYDILCNVYSRDYSRFIFLTALGIPENGFDKMKSFLAEYRKERARCNRRILQKINTLFRGLGALSYEEDVLPVSSAENGGTITRSHLMFALARRLIKMVGTGEPLIDYLTKVQRISLSSREEKLLLATPSRNYEYDLSAILHKKLKVDDENFTSKIHVFIGAAQAAGGLVFYPLSEREVIEGGTKFIDGMFAALVRLGVNGIAYEAENVGEHLPYLERKAQELGFLTVDGHEIHSPRDMFYTGNMTPSQEEGFYAVVGNAYLAGNDPMDAFCGPRTEKQFPLKEDRIRLFAEIGRKEALAD